MKIKASAWQSRTRAMLSRHMGLATTALYAVLFGFGLFVSGMFLAPLIIIVVPLCALGFALARKDPKNPIWDTPYPVPVYLLCLPFAFAGYLAPFRQLVFLALSPGGGPEPGWVQAMLPGAYFDWIVGWCGVWYGTSALVRGSLWHWKHAHQLQNLPTAMAGSVAIGLCELRGRARKVSAKAFTGFPKAAVLGHRLYTVPTADGSELKEESHLPPFYLEDETGRILVDPSLAGIRTSWMPLLVGASFCEIAITQRVTDTGMGERLRWIEDGDPIYLLGRVDIRKDAPADAKDSERVLVQAPRTLNGFDALLSRMLLGLGDKSSGFFFLSDTDEAAARRHMRRAVLINALWAALWIGLSYRHAGWSPPDQWFSRHDISNTYSEQPGAAWPLARLEEALHSVEPDTRSAALQAIASSDRIGKLPALIASLASSDKNAGVRRDAMGVLTLWAGKDERAERTIDGRPALVKAAQAGISDSDERVRASAAYLLGKLVPLDEARAAALAAALKDPSVSVRRAAAQALVDAHASAAPAADALEHALREDVDLEVRRVALQALAWTELPPARKLALLIPFLEHADPAMRENAASGLGTMAQAAAPAGDALAKLLQDPLPRLRFFAAQAFENMRERACAQLPALKSALAAELTRESGDHWAAKSLRASIDRCQPGLPDSAFMPQALRLTASDEAKILDAVKISWVSIPGGTFMMGSPDGNNNEKPVHQVTVKTFLMAKTPVTVRQYSLCVQAGKCTETGRGSDSNGGVAGREHYPINSVTWDQAVAFSKWVGGRLPSEAEWEFAARSGGKNRTYPWGDEAPSCATSVMMETGYTGGGGEGCGTGTTAPVCSRPRGNTEQGLCDMAGNISQWVQDVYHDSYAGAPDDGRAWESPAGTARVRRGAPWNLGPEHVRAAHRGEQNPDWRNDGVGFRPVKDDR
ncbi:MAG: SUMF1/EgtB/PvdO family nonheme iron enzyme [Elusimicrobiota bacterium]